MGYYIYEDKYKIGVITIDIELKDRNRIKDFLHKLQNKFEDATFSIIQKLPEKLIPRFLMEWLAQYLDKRIAKLKQQSIKLTWRNMQLQDAYDTIKNSNK